LRGTVARVVTMSALLAGWWLSAAPANAQCAPDPASSGQTVTCSGNVPNGFQAGAGIDNLTVNVLPAATVSDGGGAAISVNDFNTITNSGSLVAGSSSAAIFAITNNTITNTATGTITVGNDSNGIVVFGNSTVTNAGAITTGSAAGPAGGIFAINDYNIVTNTATGTINVGDDAAGIFVQGNHATVSNAGAITAGDVGVGIVVFHGDDAKIDSSGTITVGTAGAGIAVNGSSSTITNTDRIVGGDDAFGILVTATPTPSSIGERSPSEVVPRSALTPAVSSAATTSSTPERSMSAWGRRALPSAAPAPSSTRVRSMPRTDPPRSNSAAAAATC